MSHYPDENEWFLLKIVEVEEELVNRPLVIDNRVVEKGVLSLHLTLSPVSPHYSNSKSYHVWLLKGNPVVAYSGRLKREKLGWQNRDEKNLRDAVALPKDQILQRSTLLGKNVMGQCHYKPNTTVSYRNGNEVLRSENFPTVRRNLAHPDGVTVPVHIDGSITEGRVIWESSGNALYPTPGTKIQVILADRKQITAIRVGDEWRDINE